MAQGHKRDGCGFDFHFRGFKYLIFSFLGSGHRAKRGVEFCLESSAECGERKYLNDNGVDLTLLSQTLSTYCVMYSVKQKKVISRYICL